MRIGERRTAKRCTAGKNEVRPENDSKEEYSWEK